MTALLIGTALAVASLCYVLYPLLRSDPGARACQTCGPRPEEEGEAEFCSTCGARLLS